MKTLCLYNQKAGRCNVRELKKAFRERPFWGDVTFHALGANSLDLNGLLDGCEKVAVFGGDGTVHHVIQSLAFRNVELNVFPMGTANDLCYALGSTDCLKDLLDGLENGKRVAYDTISLNGRHVITGGGFGLGYQAADSANRLRSGALGFLFRRGFRSQIYLLTLGWHGFFSPPPKVRYQLRVNEKTMEGTTQSLLFCNQSIMGKNILVAPGTSGVDGRFQVMRFLNGNTRSVLKTLIHLKSGSPSAEKFLDRHETQQAEIEFETPVAAYGDGEIFSPQTLWQLRCHRGSISLRTPAAFMDEP